MPPEDIVLNMQHVEYFVTHTAIFSASTEHEHSDHIFFTKKTYQVFMSGTVEETEAMVRRHQTCWIFEPMAMRAKNQTKT